MRSELRQHKNGRLWLRAACLALGVGVLAAGALAVAGWRYMAALPPLDLARVAERSTVVLDRNGTVLRAFTMPDGRWRLPATVDDVDPRFLDILMAYEDRRFRAHVGVDPLAMLRAGVQMAGSGRIVSGGSTLTMQAARLMEPRAARSYEAKLRQMARAVELEQRFSKNEILAFYLSLAPYGGNLEGIRAASFAYFGKEPRRLSVAEAALLVALPQSPEGRRPDRFPERARAARDRVLDRALERGVVTEAEVAYARLAPVPQARQAFPMLAPHLTEAVARGDPTARTIRLAIDAPLQARLEGLAAATAARIGPQISAAILVMDNATGEVRAHVGAANYMATERDGWVDTIFAIRSPGSALKPFIYALAFENGIAHPETMLDDRPTRYGLYAPKNFDLNFQGMVTARLALQNSLNIPAVELLSQVGPSHFLARLKSAGIAVELPRDGGEPGLALALGGLGISLNDLGRAYAGLARGGEVPVLRRRLDNEPAQETGFPLTRAVAAWYVADVLRGAPAPANALPGLIAFKTGTSYGYRDAVAVGFDKRSTVAVWLGRPDGGAVPGLLARQTAAPLLFEAFARLGYEPEPVPRPEGALVASTSALPPPLRHLRQDVPKTFNAILNAQLRIAYPPQGATVDLAANTEWAQPLALKVLGGTPPMTWMVNGRPVDQNTLRRESQWQPDGEGFARITVIDAAGATDSVTVRIGAVPTR